MRDLFGIFDDMFGKDWFSRFNLGTSEKRDIETITFKRGDIETTMSIVFNDEGYPVTSRIISKNITAETIDNRLIELNQKKLLAVEAQNFEEAARLRDEIKQIKEPTN